VIDVLIVDDEEPARAVLREMLAEEGDVRVLAECATGLEAVKAAGELKPQAIFLDIEMPKLDGFEVLELIDPAIAIVFVTAYDSYALRAFEVHAVDYVLKPFRQERLKEALVAARARVAARPEPAVLAQTARPPGEYAQRIVVKDGARVHVFPVEALDYAQAQDDYVALRAEGRTYLKAQTMGALQASLDPARFVRVHRSYLVRLDLIRSVELYAKNSREAVLKDGTRIPVSREGHERLRELLGETGAD
jgi:two-component system LytT family response regulator